MPARAGKFPWSNISETTKTGRQRKTLSAGNYQWDLTEGWHAKRERGWLSKGKKSGNVVKTNITLPDGKVVTVYKTTGYEDTIGFHAHDVQSEDAESLIAMAFDEKIANITFTPGCGHIKYIEYSPQFLCMRVAFVSNGAVCVFMGVPTAVAGTLISLARSKTTQISSVDGKQRHVLGMEFWNLVRIRGQRHGARYPFEYEKRGEYKLTGSKKRYRVTLSDANYKNIIGGKYVGPPLKSGEQVSTILSEEEYAKYQEMFEHKSSKLGISQVINAETGAEVELDGVDIDYYAGANKGTATTTENVLHEILGEDYGRYDELRKQIATATKEAQAKRQAELAEGVIDNSEAAKKEVWSRYMSDPKFVAALKRAQAYAESTGDDSAYDALMTKVQSETIGTITGNPDFADKRYKGFRVKKSLDPANVVATPHNVFNNRQDYNDWIRLTKMVNKGLRPDKYATSFVGKPWTPQKLKEFANATVPGNISVAHSMLYKRLVQSGDWEAALNFLKNHKRDLTYEGRTGSVVKHGIPYASQYDYITLTED